MSWAQRIRWGRIKFIAPAPKRLKRAAIFLVLFPVYAPLAGAFALLGFRFAPHWVFSSLGNAIALPSLLLQAERVGLLDKKKWVFLTLVRSVPNNALIEYWRGNFTIIKNRTLSFILRPLTFMPFSAGQPVFWPFPRPAIYSTLTVMFSPTTAEVSRRYEARFGSQSVLTLTEEHQSAGQRALRNLGVPPGSWWVTVHVREHASKSDISYDYRNADIRGHSKAMAFIIEQGGWVIRVGDPSMTPLRKQDCVVDYVHTDAYSDWMDLFLHANCRFQLGSDSGANLLPNLFGRPLAAVNWVPTLGNLIPDSSSMLYIQKMLREAGDGRMLPFAEMYERDLVHGGYERLGLELIDNTADEILEVTKEMFERLNCTAIYTEEDERLQAQYRMLYMRQRAQPFQWLSRAGRDFLRHYKHLLVKQGGESTRESHPNSGASRLVTR